MGSLSGEPKKETLIEKKMREKEEAAIDIDYDAIYTTDVAKPKSAKKSFFVYGEKNAGKTVACYGLMSDGDTALVLSFDNKSERPVDEEEGLEFLVDANITIKVISAVQYFNKSTDQRMLDSATSTYDYICRILEDYADPKNEKAKLNGNVPDWIIIDGTERMKQIMELHMRKKGGIPVVAGVPVHLWQHRAHAIDNIYDLTLKACKKGVIYTSFVDLKELVDNCTVVKRKEVPKWIGKLRDETDIQIHIDADRDCDPPSYIAKISGSKYPRSYPDGSYHITNKRLGEVIRNETN